MGIATCGQMDLQELLCRRLDRIWIAGVQVSRTDTPNKEMHKWSSESA